ncbi:MAG: hypothetical protein LBU51_11210 [Bacteroidales bacterium]|jgi:hypothetical protein|nr:hypothetical protein [Bacteroidales bacterium]
MRQFIKWLFLMLIFSILQTTIAKSQDNRELVGDSLHIMKVINNTGIYKNPISEMLTNKENSHKNMNIDSNKSRKGSEPFGTTSKTKHEAARHVAEKDISNRVKQKVEE